MICDSMEPPNYQPYAVLDRIPGFVLFHPVGCMYKYPRPTKLMGFIFAHMCACAARNSRGCRGADLKQ